MGQRTQILVIRENNKGQRKSRFYHHQWGFGRVMYLAVMDAVMSDYNKETFADDYNFLNAHEFSTNERLTNEERFGDWPELTDALSKADPDNLDTIRNVFDFGDNNNGGCVIYIRENETKYHNSTFKIGFLLGTEDETYQEKAFARWLSPAEYGKMNGGSDYSNEDFVDMFEKFCKYFGVEYFTNE